MLIHLIRRAVGLCTQKIMCPELCSPDYTWVQAITQIILPPATSTHPNKGQKGTLLFASGFNLTEEIKLFQNLGSQFSAVQVAASRRFSEFCRCRGLVVWWDINRGFRTEQKHLTLLSIWYFFTMGINTSWCFLRQAYKVINSNMCCYYAY